MIVAPIVAEKTIIGTASQPKTAPENRVNKVAIGKEIEVEKI